MGLLWMERLAMVLSCCLVSKRKFCQKFSGCSAVFGGADCGGGAWGSFGCGAAFVLEAWGQMRNRTSRVLPPLTSSRTNCTCRLPPSDWWEMHAKRSDSVEQM